jgi:predicted RNase H-like HicB family nuclease
MTPVEPPPSPNVGKKTIDEIVGTTDGDYVIEVCVENGVITAADVSSETNLMKTQLEEVKKENEDLKTKLKEPIGEPILAPVAEKKEWNKMSTYEKAIQRAKQEK